MTSTLPPGPLLSILIPTVPNRAIQFERLFLDLQKQIDAGPHNVEILGLLDNKSRTVGAKRNALLAAAAGAYLVFLDDDDRVADDYVAAVCRAILENPGVDAIVYDVLCSVNGKQRSHCRYSIHNDAVVEKPGCYSAWAPHVCVWRSEIVKPIPFPDRQFGEDTDWSRVASLVARTEARIDRILYWYDFDSMNSETRQNLLEFQQRQLEKKCNPKANSA
jgi:glycosyltransferase involved in cell wall biosynthesis